MATKHTGLTRQLGLPGLAATGICSMLGASIYVVPFMIHRSVPGIGPYVLPAFLFASIPAILAAFAYAILSSAMPRAGGSYLYASRGLSPYLGFVASFSQWFGLSIAIGVISYVIIPFFRDIAQQLDYRSLAAWLDQGMVRVTLSLALLWLFVFINIRGVKLYERTLIPLMGLMFGLGAVVIVAGSLYTQADFLQVVQSSGESTESLAVTAPFKAVHFLAAAALLFSSFIGFDSIAQAGGEAKDPSRSLPLAIALSVTTVGLFYFLFTAAVYHAVPWQFVAQQAQIKDITAAGLLGYLLPHGWAIAIMVGAAIALLNDLPAMILAVSRLMFAWAEDGIFPKKISNTHAKWHTPSTAIVLSGAMASIGILGSHFAGDFFLGIDIMVTAMLVNFLLMCITVIALPQRNPQLGMAVKVITNRKMQLALAGAGTFFLSGFLCIHLIKDLTSNAGQWYFHSTPVWLLVMGLASIIYFRELRKLKKAGINTGKLFSTLPPE